MIGTRCPALTRMWLPVILLVLNAQAVHAQGTAFTYQGKLSDAGNPASGNYDFQFKLFDALGTQQGATQTVSNVSVTNGIFTVQLDFGVCPMCFDGTARFLEIAVKKTTDANFTLLSPRQPITSTPYALRSLNATAADGLSVACINCITSSQIASVNGSAVTGTIPVASVPDLSAAYIKNTTSQQAASNFNISGTGTADMLNAATQFNLGGTRILSTPGTNNLFAGAGAGQANSSGANNAFFGFNAGRNNVGDAFGNGNDNAFFGSQAGQSNTGSQNSFFGRAAGVANTIGSFNSLFGNGAGQGNTGSSNSFFGSGAGANNTADGNSFFGAVAGLANTSGNGNSFFGYQAGTANTASNNSFFGYQAGLNNNSGASNTFIGAGAGNPDAASQVSDSTAIGAFARVSPCGFSGSVAVGSGANAQCASMAIGKGATASGLASVAIGNSAIASAFSSIAIGNNVQVSTSSTMVLGANSGVIKVVVPGALDVGSGIDSVGTVVLSVKGGIVFTTSGFLGVGVLAPARQLDVNGRARIESIPPEASAASVCFNAQGDLLQCGASSLRLKKNVLAFSGGLNIIRRLKPIRFDWRDGSGHDIGLGAEDVARVEPFLTFKDRDGQVAGVKYERLNILLINAVKEQQAQIERQQQQIKQAEATNQQQQQQLKRQQGELEGLKKLVCLDHPNAEVCKPEIKP